jgi:Fe-S-cluster-containing dehydrogenase component/formate-dependent nitrite reductase membrane component NrfD
MLDPLAADPDRPEPARWAKVVDHESCIGCHACTTACKSENDVPLSVSRTYVKYVDVGLFPNSRRAFQVTRCNQCEDAPCAVACPTSAMYRREDGIVDFDKRACIGCKACIAACPYDAIFINPEDGAAEKCNFCAHRLDIGLEPACVVVCPTEAILVGDLADPDCEVSRISRREPVAVRKPEKDTRPKLFYRGAHQATLDPLAARRPSGGLFMWSEQPAGPAGTVSGVAGAGNSSAEALLSYDVKHSVPWDWRVSLYTLTKGIASGIYLALWLLMSLGALEPEAGLWQWTAPIVSLLFLAITGGLLIWDLEHPERVHLIFLRPQWRSWLVRGGFILTGFGGVAVLHLLAALAGRPDWTVTLAWVGVPLAVLTAVYTAWLFAQAKARDLWQSSLLPPHLLIQSLVAGAAGLLAHNWILSLFSGPLSGEVTGAAARTLQIVTFFHLLMVAGEITLAHPTTHARLAVREMTAGSYRSWFRAGIVLSAFGMLAPALGPWVALPALAGLLAYEHAYVQSAQSVPLA